MQCTNLIFQENTQSKVKHVTITFNREEQCNALILLGLKYAVKSDARNNNPGTTAAAIEKNRAMH